MLAQLVYLDFRSFFIFNFHAAGILCNSVKYFKKSLFDSEYLSLNLPTDSTVLSVSFIISLKYMIPLFHQSV